MLRLYRQRQLFKPKRQELKHIRDSMGYHRPDGPPLRRNELGWFWVHCCSRTELEVMLSAKVKRRQCKAWMRWQARPLENRAKLHRKLAGDFASLDDRLDAIRSLASHKNKQDMPLLRQLAAEVSLPVGLALGPALTLFQSPTDVDLLFQLGKINVVPALEALVKLPCQRALAAIRNLLRLDNLCVRTNLANWLDQWRNPAAPRFLRRLARDKDEYVRAAAASSLGVMRHPEDLPLLRRMSRESSKVVRLEAVWAVGLYGRPDDIALLRSRTVDLSPKVSTVATMALTRLMPRAELERWLYQDGSRMSFEVLRELDFAIYAPAWVKKAHPRIGDDILGFDLGMCKPGFGMV